MSNITIAVTEGFDSVGVPCFTVKTTDWDGYPSYSVLAGQPIVKWVGSYDTLEEALKEYPKAELDGGVGENHFDHLPDENEYSTRTMHDTWEGEQ